jgi:hypothetical protein
LALVVLVVLAVRLTVMLVILDQVEGTQLLQHYQQRLLDRVVLLVLAVVQMVHLLVPVAFPV